MITILILVSVALIATIFYSTGLFNISEVSLNPIFQSVHFTLNPLADGVYAAIATEMGAGFSNAGMVDLGGQTLVFDAFQNPLAAQDLLKACLELTGRKPSAVILSHWHPDHWGGMQVFADCPILATEATRKAMLSIVREMERDKLDPSRMEQELRVTESRLAAATDPQQQHLLAVSITRQRFDLQALATLQPTLPNQTFDGKIIFHGTKCSAELIPTGKGHTESDCILRLLKSPIAFIGDIGFFQSQPFMFYSFPDEWLVHLDGMAVSKTRIFVPGHGPLGSKKDLLLEAKYIRALEDMVEDVIRHDGKVMDAMRQTLPPPFDAWQLVGSRFEANVRSSYKRQSKMMILRS